MVWPIRSIMMSYTVTLILQLVEEGKPSLEDTLNKYVGGVTDGDQITLLELANMSSGNADYVNAAFLSQWQATPRRSSDSMSSTAVFSTSRRSSHTALSSSTPTPTSTCSVP